MARKQSTTASATKRAKTGNQKTRKGTTQKATQKATRQPRKTTQKATQKTTRKARVTTTKLVTRKADKEGETMATERVKEMINMMPNMMMDPSELLRETTKVWTRSFDLVNEMTGKLNNEMWTQGIKSYDETQKMYRTSLETLHTWTDTWQTQTQQSFQRFVEMTPPHLTMRTVAPS
jgi:CO dehydrogenase/acetyl-CoA synthase alpha subunit